MSFRAWCLVAAIGLGQIAIGQAYGQSDSGQEGTAAEQEQPHAPAFAIPVEIIESEEAADARARSEREAEEREKHDLIAQQGMHEATDAMNRATQDMARYALISTVTVILGTALLFWTLLLTRQANCAAQTAVNVTREIGRDQARAYVEVDSAFFYWGSEAGRFPDIKISVRNHGATPAKWFQVRTDYMVYSHSGGADAPAAFENLPMLGEFGRRWNGIGQDAKGQTAAGPQIRDWQEIAQCRRESPRVNFFPPDNSHGLVVFGEVRYCTIFNEVFVSQFYFGLGSLEPYKSEEPVEIDRVETPHGTQTVRERKEIPQRLSRFPISLELYKRQEDS